MTEPIGTDVALGTRFRALVKQGKLIATPVALKFTGPIEWDEYVELGEELGNANRLTRWFIGDWVLYGEGTFGEKCAQAAEATGLTPDTVRNYASVCKRVVPSRRKHGVGIGIHMEVARLDPADQRRFLGRAVREGLTQRDLRERIQEEFPPLPRGTQTIVLNTSDELPPTLPVSYLVDGPVCRRLVKEAIEAEPGWVKVPRDAVERIASVIGAWGD